MNKFDRVLLRTNGILFLVVVLLMAWTASQAFLLPRHYQRGPGIVATPFHNPDEKQPMELGRPSRLNGTPFIRMSLQSEEAPSSSFKTRESRVCNYLYLNGADLSSSWLFQGFDRLISQVHDLRAAEVGNDRPVVATLFEVISADTDGDHRLTTNDREAVYFSGPSGKNPIEIIPPTDGIQSVEQIAPEQVLVIYRREDTIVAGLFSIKDGSKIKESKVQAK
jgi:hypothetical protein